MESSFYTDPNCCHLAIHLMLKVNHSDKKIVFNKKEILVKRGEVITGREKLARETGLTERSIRTSLALLKNIGFLTIKPTNRYSIIQLQKYDEYQKTDQHVAQQTTSRRPADDHKQVMISNDNITNTNVLEEEKSSKKEYGDPVINEGINLLKELFGSVSNMQKNRYALKRLYTAKTKDRVLKAMRFAHKMRKTDKFCPLITNYLDLEQKWEKLEDYARGIQKEQKEKQKVEYLEDIIAAESTPEQWEATARKAGLL